MRLPGGTARTCLLLLCISVIVSGFPESGKWTLKFNSTKEFGGINKNLYNGTEIRLKLKCESNSEMNIRVGWVLRETQVREK